MLLLTPGREAAIENIKKAAAEGRFNDKTEPFDPQWDEKELKENILRYVSRLDSPLSKIKRLAARTIVDSWIRRYSDGVNEIRGLEKLSAVEGPAFVTSNHFNPFDNGILRTMARRSGHGRLCAISQGTNFVMPGLNGFVMRNIDVIPLISDREYMEGPFVRQVQKQFGKGRFILIYPEQEMWFNYRKPRPQKRGAFLFSARFGVPLVPCFVELEELPREIAPGFMDVKCILHILDPIFPDPSLSERENSIRMCRADFEAKKTAYETIYCKPLDYTFSPWDIAGFKA